MVYFLTELNDKLSTFRLSRVQLVTRLPRSSICTIHIHSNMHNCCDEKNTVLYHLFILCNNHIIIVDLFLTCQLFKIGF